MQRLCMELVVIWSEAMVTEQGVAKEVGMATDHDIVTGRAHMIAQSEVAIRGMFSIHQ